MVLISLAIAMAGLILALIISIQVDTKTRIRHYDIGYNDCIKDIDDKLSELEKRGIDSLGIITMRNMIFEDYEGVK